MTSLGGGSPSEDEITYNKRTFMYLFGVVVMQSLLIPGGPYDGGVSLLFEHVNVCLVLLLGLLLVVEMNTGCIKVEVRGDDYLGPVDKEEGL